MRQITYYKFDTGTEDYRFLQNIRYAVNLLQIEHQAYDGYEDGKIPRCINLIRDGQPFNGFDFMAFGTIVENRIVELRDRSDDLRREKDAACQTLADAIDQTIKHASDLLAPFYAALWDLLDATADAEREARSAQL